MSLDQAVEDVVNGINGDGQTNSISKAAAIRKTLQNVAPETKPAEIADLVKQQHGIDVTPAYVSLVKSQVMRKVNTQPYQVLRIAKKLIRECDGVKGAKEAIDAVMDEMEMTKETRSRYESLSAEIDMRLEDTERPLDPMEKRELQNEKRNILKLIEALDSL
jgi:hypothetical protein